MGHWLQRGDFGVQTLAPNSIIAWLKSPGLSVSTIVFAIFLKQAQNMLLLVNGGKQLIVFIRDGSFMHHKASVTARPVLSAPMARTRHSTRMTFPSTAPVTWRKTNNLILTNERKRQIYRNQRGYRSKKTCDCVCNGDLSKSYRANCPCGVTSHPWKQFQKSLCAPWHLSVEVWYHLYLPKTWITFRLICEFNKILDGKLKFGRKAYLLSSFM